jgi:ceramide glucosyltransferase
MTLIKPVKGLEEGLRENFEAIPAADPEGRLQVIVAMEDAEDPAYPVMKAFAQAHPGRVELVLAGPSGPRMGKAHNMAAALPKARHPYVIFSDADIRTTMELVRWTGRAFEEGSEAVFALPVHDRAPGLGGALFQIAFNHSFCLPAALSFRLTGLPFTAGAWMAYKRSTLDRLGGLEPFVHCIADDFSIGWAALRSGARARLLPVPVPLKETGSGAGEAFVHLVKWSRIIHWTTPLPYYLVPLVCPGPLALALGYWKLFALLAASRTLVGLVQDAQLGSRMAWPVYFFLGFSDLGTLIFWLSGLPRRIEWRGKRYRLSWGGRAEVISPSA